jgi:hypothetical protein
LLREISPGNIVGKVLSQPPVHARISSIRRCAANGAANPLNNYKYIYYADGGGVTIYSCLPGQRAGESASNGGYFSENFLNTAKAWAAVTNPTNCLTLDDAFAKAKNETYRLHAPQTPQMEGGRFQNPFPFAVVA